MYHQKKIINSALPKKKKKKKINTQCITKKKINTQSVFQLGIENGGARLWKKGTSARQKL